MALTAGNGYQAMNINSMMDIARAFVAKQMALRLAVGGKKTEKDKLPTREVVMLQIKNMAEIRNKVFGACNMYQYVNYGESQSQCADMTSAIDYDKLNEIKNWVPQETTQQCRWSPQQAYSVLIPGRILYLFV